MLFTRVCQSKAVGLNTIGKHLFIHSLSKTSLRSSNGPSSALYARNIKSNETFTVLHFKKPAVGGGDKHVKIMITVGCHKRYGRIIHKGTLRAKERYNCLNQTQGWEQDFLEMMLELNLNDISVCFIERVQGMKNLSTSQVQNEQTEVPPLCFYGYVNLLALARRVNSLTETFPYVIQRGVARASGGFRGDQLYAKAGPSGLLCLCLLHQSEELQFFLFCILAISVRVQSKKNCVVKRF